MRGQYSLYSSLFPPSVSTEPERLGKRNALISERDDALACRYYYHAEIKRLRYDDCLAALEKEFFITASVIMQRLALNSTFLKDLIKESASTAFLKKKYPFYAW
ncbi:MAG: hypothetical protein WBP45_13240 [Daejeonella sp.]